MAKNRFSVLPNQQTPAMSHAHSHTVGVVADTFNQDDDEDDICPVCDGECTCDNRPRVIQQPMSLNQYSLQFAGSSSSSTISSLPRSPPKPSTFPLKIKLTVPPNLLANKKHASASNKSKNNQKMTSAFAPAGDPHHTATPSSIQSQSTVPKRRGRPPKAVIAAREAAKAQAAARLQSPSPPPSHFSQPYTSKNVGGNKRKKPGPQQKRGLKASRAGPKRPLKRKRHAPSDDDESSLSNLSDADYDCDDDDDGESIQFPTFVSASALSSTESGNSSSSSDLSDSDALSSEKDSDIEEEEESFIVSQVHEKARLRRELLGEDGRRNHDPHSDWVIRPRKKSVGPSDNEMNVDSDGTEEEDEEEEDEQDPDEDDEETDGRGVGAGYTGLVTAWSDDDESSFDADIFFANLTDSDTRSDSSCSHHDETGEDGDQSDMDTASHSDTAGLVSQRQELENLQLEVTQGWDGQIVFTNGLSDGRGILDIDFEVEASQFMTEASPLPVGDSDVEMSSTSIGTPDEGGYEEDADGADGDTTDEELVGEDDLPNERAMQMFSLPFSVSAINPLSTVSPVVSPAPRRRLPFSGRGIESPKPEDILSGRVFWDSDDHDHDELEERRERSRSQGSSRMSGPRTGLFVPIQETRRAIIDGTKEVPSPHPRFNRRRGLSTTTGINVVEQMLRKHLLNNSRSTPTFATASELLSPLQLLSSDNDFGSPSPSLPLSALTEELEPLTNSIDLDDVLEASFLAAESSEASDNSLTKRASGGNEEEKLSSGKHLRNLTRWDLISVGAFRQTRENGGWSSDNHTHTPHSSVDYNNIMKASPLSAIMWPKEKKDRERRRKNLSEPIAISPVILPVRDGDRTPTGSGSQHQNGFNHDFDKHTQKPRKESKRERKLKKKNWGPVHHQHSHHHQWHSHQHHPNSKMRGSAANQRSLSAVPPFNL